MNQRRKLTDILAAAGGGDNFRNRWDTTEAADDFGPLPASEYLARIEAGELEASRTRNTPGYKLTFIVIEGEFAGRKFWHDIWLTDAALPMAKRDLGKLGVTSLEQLEQPLPQGIVCRVRLTLRTDDDGTQRNRVRTFDVVRIDPPTAEPFAPDDESGDAA